jgi:Putative beta-barrel porin-2, OmpL-like. bbp2
MLNRNSLRTFALWTAFLTPSAVWGANPPVTDANPPATEDTSLQSVLAGLDFTGGLSAGIFSTSHAGQGNSDNEWMVSNLLLGVSLKDKNSPVGLTAAIGETSTPTILGMPETTNSIDVEYASVDLQPLPKLNIKVGLLQPNAGYESSYTYNNKNTFLGAVASQQPYNAYGAQIGYDFKYIQVVGGYYKDRLADDEYMVDGHNPDETWEVGVSGTVMDTSISVYHYHIDNQRNLTGAVVERTIGSVDFGFNMDYWRWDDSLSDLHEDDSSLGGAFYVIPHFGDFSIPLRLEYIDQGKSTFYLDNVNTHTIYAVTLSPTYRFSPHAYLRADFGYVHADDGFTDSNDNVKNDRVCLAAEIGYTF